MKEITETKAALSPVAQKFLLHWGQMGTQWGVNRTVAQIHALLYLSEEPLTAEEIADTLGVARSNVSTSLHELQNWRLVKTVHVLGDRRDRFESMRDVWEMFRLVAEERKRREIDPTLAVLRETVAALEKEGRKQDYAKERLREMLGFFETVDGLCSFLHQFPPRAIGKMLAMKTLLAKVLGRRG